MQSYTDLIKALRSASAISSAWEKLMQDAAAAIEALDRLLDQNTQRCEALRGQLREAHESYERHLNELEAQLPKRGEIVRCGECRYRITAHGISDGWVLCSKPYTERGNAMHRADWFCGDGEREVQE